MNYVNYAIIVSGNGLASLRRQAIIQTISKHILISMGILIALFQENAFTNGVCGKMVTFLCRPQCVDSSFETLSSKNADEISHDIISYRLF